MKLIIFEDNKEKFLFPYCINHASFEIKVGLYSNLDRIVSHHKDNDGVYLIVRKEIEKIVKYRYPNFTVNPKIVPKGKYFNARNTILEMFTDRGVNVPTNLNVSYDEFYIMFSKNELSILIEDLNVLILVKKKNNSPEKPKKKITLPN